MNNLSQELNKIAKGLKAIGKDEKLQMALDKTMYLFELRGRKEAAKVLGKMGAVSNADIDLNGNQLLDILESYNYHSVYALLETIMKRKPEEEKVLEMLLVVHNKKGHLPLWADTIRSYIISHRGETWIKEQIEMGSSSTIKSIKAIPKKYHKHKPVQKLLDLLWKPMH